MCNTELKVFTNAQKVAYAIFTDNRNSFMSLLLALYNKDFSSLSIKDDEAKELLSSLSADEKENLHNILMGLIKRHPIIAC